MQRGILGLSPRARNLGVEDMGRLLLAPWPILSIGAVVASTPPHLIDQLGTRHTPSPIGTIGRGVAVCFFVASMATGAPERRDMQ